MNRSLLTIALLSVFFASTVSLADGTEAKAKLVAAIKGAIGADAVRADIAELSSDEMGGRFFRSPFAEKAAKWVQARLEVIGIAPGASSDSFRQPIDNNPESGPNIIGMLSGSGDGFIIVSAHYDHLRPRRTGTDKIFNGADDNASGIAGLLAVARAMKVCAAAGNGPACTVIFIAFNGEEAGLLGSKAYVKSPTVVLGKIRGVFNMDMISRGPPRQIFIDGGAVGSPVVDALKAANESIGLTLQIDKHPDWLDRSDQGPFLARRVPAVLFSVEDHEDYHQVSDEVGKVDAGLASEVAQLVALAAINLSRSPFVERENVEPASTVKPPADAKKIAPQPAPAIPVPVTP